MGYTIRGAREDDLPSVADLFMASFPDSIQHYFDKPPGTKLVSEPFALCLATEPEAFIVAEAAGGGLAGYLFAPARTGRLRLVALTGGFAFRWLWRWASGEYGIGLAPVRALAANKWQFLLSDRRTGVEAEARILSLAVHPCHQGKGVAGTLCRIGLERLDRLGARPVRLEVRPENKHAVALYCRLGFREVDRTRDGQGEWLVMLRG